VSAKSKRDGTPRRHKFRRKQRLESAKSWLPTYEGNKRFQAYRKRYGVNWETAFTELEMLGVQIDPAYKEQVLRTEAREAEIRREKKLEKARQIETSMGFEQDDNFAMIIGYISGGAPYGVTWEEWNEIQDTE